MPFNPNQSRGQPENAGEFGPGGGKPVQLTGTHIHREPGKSASRWRPTAHDHQRLSGATDPDEFDREFTRQLTQLGEGIRRPAHAINDMANGMLPDEARPDLTPNEAKAVRDYSGGGWRVNAALRGESALTADHDRLHKTLQSAFAKTEDFPEPISVVRGFKVTPEQYAALLADFQGRQSSGDPVTAPDYWSTTVSGGVGQQGGFSGNVLYRIKASRGLDMMPHATANPAEQELLLPAGAKYTVRGVAKDARGRLVVDMDQSSDGGRAATPTTYTADDSPTLYAANPLWKPEDHPRGVGGKWIRHEAIREAAFDPERHREVRGKAADEGERKKFDAAVQAVRKHHKERKRDARSKRANTSAEGVAKQIEAAGEPARKWGLDKVAHHMGQALHGVHRADTSKGAKTAIREGQKSVRQAEKLVARSVRDEADRYADTLGVSAKTGKLIAKAIADAWQDESLFNPHDDHLETAKGSADDRQGAIGDLENGIESVLDHGEFVKGLASLQDLRVPHEDFDDALKAHYDPKPRETVGQYKARLERLGVEGLPEPTEDDTPDDFAGHDAVYDHQVATAKTWLTGWAEHVQGGRAATPSLADRAKSLTAKPGDRAKQDMPIPHEKRPYKIDLNEQHRVQNTDAVPTTRLDPATLTATQDFVVGNKLSQLEGDLREDRPAIVVRHGGKDYIDEGHHRALHALRTGQKVPVKHVEIGPDGKWVPVSS